MTSASLLDFPAASFSPIALRRFSESLDLMRRVGAFEQMERAIKCFERTRPALDALVGHPRRCSHAAATDDPSLAQQVERAERMVYERLTGNRAEIATRAATLLIGDNRDWIPRTELDSVGLNKNSVYSAFRHRSDARRGERGAPQSYSRSHLLEYVIDTYSPKPRRP